MTTPKIETVKSGGSRFYVHPDSGVKYPGVTSILGVLPKPALKRWAEGRVAERAIDDFPMWIGMVIRGDRDEALKYLKGAPYARSGKAAAEKGTDLHEIFESLARGEKVLKRDVHPDHWAETVHFKEFLRITEAEFHEMEATVFSEYPRYSGTMDALATLSVPDPDTREIHRVKLILDYKTGKGVYEETALQLTAYATADYILRADGTRDPVPEVEGAAVLHVRPEFWALIPVQLSVNTRRVFEAAAVVHEFETELKREMKGKEIVF